MDNSMRAENAYSGTMTGQNLMTAFDEEARAYTKYKIYGLEAGDEGLPVIRRLFDQNAENEREHAEVWLRYLGEVGNTEQNLRNAAEGETSDRDNMYPEMARVAQDEGFDELAEKFRLTATVENRHRQEFEEALEGLVTGDYYRGDANTLWQCLNCGLEVRGNMPPERCPLCSYPRDYFMRACFEMNTDD